MQKKVNAKRLRLSLYCIVTAKISNEAPKMFETLRKIPLKAPVPNLICHLLLRLFSPNFV